MPTDVLHFVRGYIQDPRCDGQKKQVREGKETGLQGLIYEIDDFPKGGEVWFIERAKNWHDDVFIPRILVVGKEIKNRDTVIMLIFATFR